MNVLAPVKNTIIIGGIIRGILALVEILPFIFFAELVRLFLLAAPREEFIRVAIYALIVLVVSGLGNFLLITILHFIDAAFAAQLRRRMLSVLAEAPLGWFRRRDSSEVRQRVGDDVAGLHSLIVHGVPDAVAAVVTPIAVLIYLGIVDWKMMLVLLIPVLLYVVAMAREGIREKEVISVLLRHRLQMAQDARHFLASQDTIRILGDKSIVDLESTLWDTSKVVHETQDESAQTKTVLILLTRPATMLALVVLGGWLLKVDAPTEAVFLILGTAFGGQLVTLSFSMADMLAGREAKDSIELLLATPTLATVHSEAESVDTSVRFRDVSFDYQGRQGEQALIPDLNLELAAGTTTAIVGESGGGKSTIAALLARLWDPQKGEISIGGKNIAAMSQEELYAKVGVLLQDVRLVRDTVAANIALAKPDASREEIEEAARQAQIHEEILQLPQGYDTVDPQLSGGQRQRIGIARMLVANTPVVVLDEPTASTDYDNEQAIHAALKELLRGRTVLIIAHRLHTLQDADRILVVKAGKIIAEGCHGELLSSNETYRELWEKESIQ